MVSCYIVLLRWIHILVLIGLHSSTLAFSHRHNRQIHSSPTTSTYNYKAPIATNSPHRNPTTLHALPLIPVSDTWGNIAVLSSVATVSQYLGKTTLVGKLLGPPVTAMAIAFVLGSVGVLSPGGSPSTKALQLLSLQLATPMILLGVNLQDCKKNGGTILIAFLIASLATWIGSFLAIYISPLSHSMFQALGDDAWKIAAALLAKNIGGGIVRTLVKRICVSMH